MKGRISGNYVGCGILDMCKLGNQKGYDLVACTVTNAIFVVKEESQPFLNKNNIEELFDYRRITYAFSAGDGAIFFSQRPTKINVGHLSLLGISFKGIKDKPSGIIFTFSKCNFVKSSLVDSDTVIVGIF